MDPISQGIVGATVVQQLPRWGEQRGRLLVATGLAFASAMAPDLDVLIRSSEDPLKFLVYHRQFSHSLIFIPFGGLLCALLGYWAAKRVGFSFAATYVLCTLAYATHGLLDACTSYGTLLLWPFSDLRVAWHVMPIVDPFYTLPLLGLCFLRLKSGRIIWSRLALGWLFALPLFGLLQQHRAELVATDLAASRGHMAERLEVRPGFGNLFVWRSVYQAEGPVDAAAASSDEGSSAAHYYVDAIHVGTKSRLYEGERVPVLQLTRDFSWLDSQSQQAQDIERFRWFSNGYLSVDPSNVNRIVDMRYSMMPHEIKPLWGIVLAPERAATEHVEYSTTREVAPGALGLLGRMVLGRPLAED